MLERSGDPSAAGAYGLNPFDDIVPGGHSIPIRIEARGQEQKLEPPPPGSHSTRHVTSPPPNSSRPTTGRASVSELRLGISDLSSPSSASSVCLIDLPCFSRLARAVMWAWALDLDGPSDFEFAMKVRLFDAVASMASVKEIGRSAKALFAK